VDSLILENVRCFKTLPRIPIRPITLLVGENSTGKTTVLASIRILADLVERFQTPDFNEDPFQLGSFKDIANNPGSRWQAKDFSLGLEIAQSKQKASKSKKSNRKKPVQFLAKFIEHSAQPILSQWTVSSGEFSLSAQFTPESDMVSIDISTPRCSNVIPFQSAEPFMIFGDMRFFLHMMARDKKYMKSVIDGDGDRPSSEDIKTIQHSLDIVTSSFHARPYAVAPVRTKPKRTYDPISEHPTPEGDHIPMVLARMSNANPVDWVRLCKQLAEFGKASGLFETITVKNLSRAESGPFQIRLSFGGPKYNLVDIGYGVSQGLPVVVDALRAKKGQTVLIQQPEVHLHPRAQASLGSLLAGLAVTEKKRFVIETHSDHLIDRIRMDVRDGVGGLKPTDVSIIYFERSSGSEVDIYPMTVDKLGNLCEAPCGYRRFFLEEERRFLEVR